MILLSYLNHLFFLLFIYLIDVNANQENWIDGFFKSIYCIVIKERCFFFLGFLKKPNKDIFIFNNYSFVLLIFEK